MVATTRISNNTMFASIDAYKTFVQREKDDVKEFSRIAANTARTFESSSREFANNRLTDRLVHYFVVELQSSIRLSRIISNLQIM